MITNAGLENPYVGPDAFSREDRDRYFGREREARELLFMVTANRLVLFYARSGAGKTSLLNARLIPDLEERGFEVLPVGRVGGGARPDTTLGDNFSISEAVNPFVYNLMSSMLPDRMEWLTQFAGTSLADFLLNLVNKGDGYDYATEGIVNNGDDKIESDVDKPMQEETEATIWPRILILDQFEEILTANLQAWDKRADFFDQLRQAMEIDPYLWVLLTLREDYVAGLDPYAHLLPDGMRARFYMQPMGHQAALEAIERPAEKFGCPFEPGVAQTLVENLCQIPIHGQEGTVAGQFIEPVQLQVVCYQLWEEIQARGKDTITWDDLPLGYIDQALSNFYEDALRDLVDVVKETGMFEDRLRDWFEDKLITEHGTRGTVFRGESDTEGLPNAAVDRLEDRHVLRTETRAGGRWVELIHDRLVDPIVKANAAWRQDHPLLQAALAWKDAERPKSKLYQGEQLAAASKDPDAEMGLVREFLRAGRQVQEEREAKIRAEEEQKRREAEIRAEEQAKRAAAQARANRRLRWLAAVLCVASVLTLSLWGYANSQRQEAFNAWATAEANAEAATTAQAKAVDAQATAEANAEAAATAQAKAVDAWATAEANATAAATAQAEAEHQRKSALAQSLAVLAQIIEKDDELATLLAVEAFTINQRVLGPANGLIDNALGNVLSRSYFYTTLRGHTDGILSVAFSSDGKWLASGAADGTVRLWDLEDPNVTPIVLRGHEGWVNAVAFSSNDAHRQWLASGGADGTVRLWDVENPKAPIEFDRWDAHARGVESVAFDPQGRWLASGGRDRMVRLWNLKTLEEERNMLPQHDDVVLSVAFSPNGRWLASGSADDTVRVWALGDQGTVTLFGGLPLNAWVRSVAFDPHERWLAAGCVDDTVWLWDLNDPDSEPYELPISDGDFEVNAVAFSPDGDWLASGSYRMVRLWDMERLWAEPTVLHGHDWGVHTVAFDPQGRWLASGAGDSTVRLWELTGSAVERVMGEHDGGVETVAFSPPDGRWLASGSRDQTVRLWDFEALSPLSETEASNIGLRELTATHLLTVNSVIFSPDGRWLASGGDDTTVRLWNMEAPVTMTLDEPDGRVKAVAFSHDGRWLASGDAEGVVWLWDVSALLDTGVSDWSRSDIPPANPITATMPSTDASGINAVAFSPDGKRLASGGRDGIMRLWDVSVLSVLREAESRDMDLRDIVTTTHILTAHAGGVDALAFNPGLSSWTLASGGEDGTVRLWDLRGAVGKSTVLRGHTDRVYAVAFSSDGRWLASGSFDRTIRLWDPQNLDMAPRVLEGHDWEVMAVAFSPDGRWLASGSMDRKVRLWIVRLEDLVEFGCQKVRRNLTDEEWKRYLPGEDYRATCPNLPTPPVR